MTTWRYHLCVLVFLCIISSSEGNCYDYFDVNNWKENLSDEIYLVETKNPKDRMECTLEREYLKDTTKDTNIRNILHHCFKGRKMVTDITEKCKGNTTEPLPLYHIMCLTAKQLNITLSICKYDTVCKLYSEEEPTACVETPTVLSQTTSTDIPNTTPAWTKSETATGTTQSTPCACSGEKSHSKDKQEQEHANFSYICIIFITILVISIFCYLGWLCWQKQQKQQQQREDGSLSERESMTDVQCPEEPREERREMTAV